MRKSENEYVGRKRSPRWPEGLIFLIAIVAIWFVTGCSGSNSVEATSAVEPEATAFPASEVPTVDNEDSELIEFMETCFNEGGLFDGEDCFYLDDEDTFYPEDTDPNQGLVQDLEGDCVNGGGEWIDSYCEFSLPEVGDFAVYLFEEGGDNKSENDWFTYWLYMQQSYNGEYWSDDGITTIVVENECFLTDDVGIILSKEQDTLDNYRDLIFPEAYPGIAKVWDLDQVLTMIVEPGFLIVDVTAPLLPEEGYQFMLLIEERFDSFGCLPPG